MNSLSVAVVSSMVAKTPDGFLYSFVFDESHKLAERGVRVHIVRSIQEEESFSHGIHFHGLSNTSRIRYVPIALRHLSSVPKLGYCAQPWVLLHLSKYAEAVTSLTNTQNVDLIHAHFAYPEGLVGLLAKKETKKPLVVTVHGYDILVEPLVGYGARLKRRVDVVVRQVLNNADIVIAASNATFNEARKIVKDTNKVQLIPNGVDVERFRPNLDGSFMEKKLHLQGQNVVFALRSHESRYGLEYLVRSALMVIKEKNNVIFVIGGEGSLRHYHEQLAITLGANGKIIFTGRIPRNEVPYYYAMSDIVVVPSLQEGFGLVVSEAMACGKPVVGSNVGGIPDQIIDGYNGFLVPPKNPSKIAEKLLWLIANPKKAHEMGSNGRRIVEKKFDLTKRVDKIIELYEALTQ